jgi:hypothetical protein
MFLDVRDQWPPVPPPSPQPGSGSGSGPQTGRPLPDRRKERVVGLVVAINLGLVLLSPLFGTAVAQALTSLYRSMHQ